MATVICVSTFSVPAAQAAATNNPINTSSRAAVTSAYLTRYVPATKSQINWTGAVTGCKPGTQSADSLAKSASAINFYRGMSGLDSITLNSTLNARAQSAALLMAANGALSHTPPKSWRCYSTLGASGANTSNLHGGAGYTIPSAASPIEAYMTDYGANNTKVGHRRWLLSPKTTTMGVGTTKSHNAVTVIGTASSPSRATPAFMPFPNAGYFPQQLEPLGRWSLSSNHGVDFTRATISVKRNGKNLSVSKHPVSNSYGMPNTVVFEVKGIVKSSGYAPEDYTVSVVGMKRNGAAIAPYTYTVKLFNPLAESLMSNLSIKSSADILAYDNQGAFWNYGPLTGGSARRSLGNDGAGFPESFHVTDWNADGIQDVLVQKANGQLQLKRGMLGGGLILSNIGQGWNGYDITVGKWKKSDKYPSIIAKSQTTGELFAYGNTTGGTVSSRVKLGSGWKGYSLYLLDWNKDGSTAVVAKNSAGPGVFLNEGRATIGSGWNSLNSIQTVTGHNGSGTVGIVGRDAAGQLHYYQANKNTWAARKTIGWGFESYRLGRS